MKIPIVFLILPNFMNSILVAKQNVSYDFLASRTIANSSMIFLMNELFGPTIQSLYDNVCQGNFRCFFPVFWRNEGLSYILLTDEQNSCTNLPNCLPFNQSTYANFTIIFGAQNSTQTSIASNLSVPKCSGYFFTRANGRNWCYDFGESLLRSFYGAQSYCAAQNKYLNGFESFEEQQAFFDTVQKNFGLGWMIRLGAIRSMTSCLTQKACLEVQMAWLSSIISTNISLANSPTGVYFDGDGDTLVYRYVFGQWGYDDLINTFPTYFSCGWYAY